MIPFLIEILEFAIIALYGLSLLMICIFSLGQLHLTYHYIQNKKNKKESLHHLPEPLPRVTVQLPVFNEKYVAERLIHCIVKLRYPSELLQIQVLDDSTDETTDVVHKLVQSYQNEGIRIENIKRKQRDGFKAGALQNGLNRSDGEFIAIFDSDFLPQDDFLLKTLPYFEKKDIGMVQSRWGHLNEDYSILTQVQAFGLNAHFSIEQSGRKAAGSFINFNGTAGIWRKECILDAGGWSSDTLTEDLDLSYRAQLRFWKFEFIENLISPAELPVMISAIKTQQFRWNKGAAETGRKLIRNVLASSLSRINKVHAVMHLFNSSVFVFLFMAGLLSIPVLILKQGNPVYEILFRAGIVLLAGFFSIVIFYWVAYKNAPTRRNFFITFATFMVIIMGLSYHNTKAVLQGLIGFKSPFLRTPKFNVLSKSDKWIGNTYISYGLKNISWMEGLFSLYFMGGLVLGISYSDYDLIAFHLLLALGFASVFYQSARQASRTRALF